MLTEERFSEILKLLDEKRAVTVTELTELLQTSESTIRRDLNTLDEMGKLKKVHGGATVLGDGPSAFEEDVAAKAKSHMNEKNCIAKYAASLIHDDDFVFIDAGTTTEQLIQYLTNTRAVFVTNGIVHAKKLLKKGLKAYVIGGQLKLATEAIIGAQAVDSLRKYNFTKCFLGTNGVSAEAGYSTPDLEEALIKEEAVKRSYVTFVLADRSKFGKVSSVTFAELKQACIITDQLPDAKYAEYTTIKEAGV